MRGMRREASEKKGAFKNPGRRGRKNLLAALVAAVMAFSLLPAPGAGAFAEEELTEAEDNGNTTKANPLPLGATMHGVCESASSWHDADNFRFEFTESGRFMLDFRFPANTSTGDAYTIYVYNADRKTIFSFSLKGSDYDGSWAGKYQGLLAKGRYTISIESYDDEAGWGQPYTLKVGCKALFCEDEPNGTIQKANALPAGKILYGSAFAFDSFDEDCFVFDVAETSKLLVDFKYENKAPGDRAYAFDVIQDDWDKGILQYSFFLKGSDGDGKWAGRNAMFLKPGRYYIRTTCWSTWPSWGSEYTLSVNTAPMDAEQEINGSYETASPMLLSRPYHGSLLAANGKTDSDYYTFVLAKETPVAVTFAHEGGTGAEPFAKLALWDANGKKIGKDFLPGTNEYSAQAAFGKLGKGQYYIRVDSVENAQAWGRQYTLTVGPSAPTGPATPATGAATGLDLGSLKPAAKDMVYTGKARKPSYLSVRAAAVSKKLLPGKDFTVVALKNNKAIGVASMTVKGMGDYSGTAIVKFRIVPKKTNVKKVAAAKRSIRITWKKTAAKQKVSGYKVYYRAKGAAKWKVRAVSAKSSKLTIKRLKKGKRYEVRIRTYKKIKSGKSKGTYYAAYSAVKRSAKVK